MKVTQWIKRKSIWLYAKIVKEKASPEYVARGWAIGMFYGCLIPFGLQLVLSIPTSFILKGSKAGATLGTLITNHLTIFIIYPVQCYVGSRIIGGDITFSKVEEAMAGIIREQSWSSLMSLGGELVAAFFIGGALLALIMTPLTYFGVKKIVCRYRQKKEKLLKCKNADM